MTTNSIDKEALISLRQTIESAKKHSPAWKAKLADISPEEIRSLDDLRHLPFTTKSDLRDNYPLGLLACPPKKLSRIHASSGTTGKPTVVAYTAKDVEIWSRIMAEEMHRAGVTSEDTVQVSYGYGLFTGGLGFHYGAERLGATVIPASGGFSDRQLMLMEDLRTTVLACTPSYALRIAELVEEKGTDHSLRIGIFGAEPWSEGLRKDLEKRLHIKALDVYGLSEIMGPGVAMECPEQNGLHVDESQFILEIIDPDTGEVLPEGMEGELVVTTLCKEALPMIRYRTKDITRLVRGKCGCGAFGARIDRIKGRSDDMLIIRGVNVFPSQIEVALSQIPGLSLNYVLEVMDKEELKELTVCCETALPLPEKETQDIQRRTVAHLASMLGIRTGVKILAPGSLARSEGKAVRIKKVA